MAVKLQPSTKSSAGFGRGWLALCIALAVHVTDEAYHDFLALYNDVVSRARLPVPTFTFRTWITLLICAIVVLLSLSIYAYRGSRWLRPLAYFFAVTMIANGVAHIGGSLYLHRFAPGVYSSPLLIGAAAYLIYSLRFTAEQQR